MNRRQEALVLIGPTGSGKTPLGEMLARYGLGNRPCAHFDFGQHLRQIVAASNADDLVSMKDIALLRRVLASGALLEDRDFPLAARILQSFLTRIESQQPFLLVLNGLPRHEGQAVSLAELLDMRTVVVLRCTADVVFERIRRNSGGDRTSRADDSISAVRRKLEIYGQRTRPLIEHFRRRRAQIVELDVTADMQAERMRDMLVRTVAKSR